MIRYLTKSFGFWVGVIGCAVGLFLLSQVYSEILKEVRYSNDGQIASGTVLAKRVDTEPREKGMIDYFYVVSYEFDPQITASQRGESDVGEAAYETIDIGDEIDVEYLAGDPETHRLLGTEPGWAASAILGAMAAVFGAIGLLCLIAAVRRALRQSRLWTQGIAHTARVVELVCENPEEEQEDRIYQLLYEYEAPGGEMKKGTSQHHNRSWFGRVAEGDIIDIVVHPSNPDMSEWRREME